MSGSDDALKKLGLKKPELDVKPDDVKIVMISTCVLPNSSGGLGIQITGLGTDDKVYQFNGQEQLWITQK